MIQVNVEKGNAADMSGNNTAAGVKIDCPTLKDALSEYAVLTAAIRNMVAENMNTYVTEDQVKATVFSAFRAGMEGLPFSSKATANMRELPDIKSM